MKAIRVKKDNIVAVFQSPIDPEAMFATLDIVAEVEELARLKRQITALTKSHDSLASKIKEYMGDKESLIGGDGTEIATYKARQGNLGLDSSALKAAYPAIYEEFVVRGKDIRSFLLK